MNYYNDNDPYAAQWLRNLVAVNALPTGTVDERSILDVEPRDLAGYTQCHFFAGIGGWPYALDLAGWPADREVWTGSCPCQPLSSAGQRRGHEDERHLWPAFYALIAKCRPATVFGEQVASKDGREWLAAIRADLETLGYGVGAADLCAASVSAPHIRQRLFWVAHTESKYVEELDVYWAQQKSLQPANYDEVPHLWSEAPSPTDCVADGIPNRVGQLRAYGNAIVPQVAAELIRAVMDVWLTYRTIGPI